MANHEHQEQAEAGQQEQPKPKRRPWPRDSRRPSDKGDAEMICPKCGEVHICGEPQKPSCAGLRSLLAKSDKEIERLRTRVAELERLNERRLRELAAAHSLNSWSKCFRWGLKWKGEAKKLKNQYHRLYGIIEKADILRNEHWACCQFSSEVRARSWWSIEGYDEVRQALEDCRNE